MVILRPIQELLKMKRRFNGFKSWALITGAASGMGRVYACRLASMGYNLVLVDINSSGLEETASIVTKQIGESDAVPADMKPDCKTIQVVQDLSLKEAAENVYVRTQEEGCVVEVLVNNAGIMYCQGVAETSEKMLDRIMMVHMYTPLMLCRK